MIPQKNLEYTGQLTKAGLRWDRYQVRNDPASPRVYRTWRRGLSWEAQRDGTGAARPWILLNRDSGEWWWMENLTAASLWIQDRYPERSAS